jgi:chromatin remodeling complex protein RSC6
MPKKAVQKNTEEKQDSRKNTKKNVAVEEGDVTVQAVSAPPKAKTSTKKEAKKEDVSNAASSEASESTSESKVRRVPTRESVEQEFSELVAFVDEEIAKLRSSSAKSKGVKFLRTVNKRLKAVRNHALRVSKSRPSVRRNNTNSGFLKPVQISKDLAKFTGWDAAQPRSRVDVTKYICEYIKTNNLQDPEDKRKIRVDSDQNLKKLLKFDGKDGKPLTYYSLQTYLKSHFSPAAVVGAAPVVEATAVPSSVTKETPARKGKSVTTA